MHRMKIKFVSLIIAISMGLMMAGVLPAASYDPRIYQAQKALKARGYNPGPADGLWGRGTQRALERFQRNSGLSGTGRLDAATLGKLGIASRNRAYDRAIKRKDNKAAQRHALVIGNGDYVIAPLRNPVNDARGMADALRGLGFSVMLEVDAGQRSMENAIRDFGKRLRQGGVGLFYYAGHGVQVSGRNYLIPVNARIESESDVKYEAVDAGRVLGKMQDAENELNIVILDACRNNPFARSFRSASQGLARMDSPQGSIIAYSTAPGSVAADGEGQNSVYTQSLLKHIRTPGLTIERIFKRVRIDVVKDTGKRQTPWESSSLMGDFFFASSGAVVETPTQTSTLQQEARGAFLSVESNIAGAAVYVDGRRKGATPLSDVSVSPGAHRIRVVKPGYEPYQRQVRVDPGRTVSMYVDLSKSKPAAARLFVQTDPEGARVRILNIGPKFHQGIELDAGKYQLEVSADGYDTKKMTFFLNTGEDRNLDIRLVKKPQGPVAGDRISNSLGMVFAYIPPGTFMMGSPKDEPGRHDNETRHRVTLTRGFYMQTTEVTVAQWRAFVHETGYRTEAETGGGALIWTGSKWERKEGYFWDNPGFSQSDKHPVTCISWNDVQAYIEWLNRKGGGSVYRLPTEAEWEYAARAGTTTPFAFGNCLSTDQANYNGNYPLKGCPQGIFRDKTVSVASFAPNRWGLYDMHGNVWEWCSDWYGDYSSGSVTDPGGPSSGSARVNRGGCWYYNAKYTRSANRFMDTPDDRTGDLGFRLARTR